MKTEKQIRSILTQAIKRYSDRYIWTSPSIAATFGCRPAYLPAFKQSWLLLMWGDPARRRLREAIDVAVSTAIRCRY